MFHINAVFIRWLLSPDKNCDQAEIIQPNEAEVNPPVLLPCYEKLINTHVFPSFVIRTLRILGMYMGLLRK